MKRRVLITGASGYVAGLMLPALRERYDLTLLDVRTTDRQGNEVDGIQLVDLDRSKSKIGIVTIFVTSMPSSTAALRVPKMKVIQSSVSGLSLPTCRWPTMSIRSRWKRVSGESWPPALTMPPTTMNRSSCNIRWTLLPQRCAPFLTTITGGPRRCMSTWGSSLP